MSAGTPRAAGKPAPPSPVNFYPSKIKLGVLILPCLVGVGIALQSDEAVEFVLAEMHLTNILAILIPLFVAGVLLQMAFDRKPVVVFDAAGIHCQRPPIGLIPWSAVIGIGAANATLMRRVLMVAVDPDQLAEKARTFIRNSIGVLPFISPQLAKFKKQAAGYPAVYIPISHLSRPAREIERLAQEFVLYYVAEDE
ncbi:MAG: hypothetical protein ISR50_13990 [Alphaproteobacteria bacterium]|nr:hypothetical protein [Alphaproteobacteria bacterium]MBL6953745.1 hypothetical protein [Alphaproteobacteria bacterium]